MPNIFEVHWSQIYYMDGQIEIYHLNLGNMYLDISQMKSFLNLQEREKSKSFIFEKDRDQFILCRGALRQILSKHLACQPKEIYFEYDCKGKPRLDARYHEVPLQFNLSHTKNYALIAVTLYRQIGIDIEYLRSIANLDFLMSISLSPKELNYIHFLSKKQKLPAFLQYWTRKEALLKAWGIGLQDALYQYEVGHSGDLSLPIFIYDKKGKPWTVANIIPYVENRIAYRYEPPYVAAIAYEGSNLKIVHFSYKDCLK